MLCKDKLKFLLSQLIPNVSKREIPVLKNLISECNCKPIVKKDSNNCNKSSFLDSYGRCFAKSSKSSKYSYRS